MSRRMVLPRGHRRGLTWLAVGLAAGLSIIPASALQTPSTEVVLTRVGWYVSTFANRFSNVVAEETYHQELRSLARQRTPSVTRRDLKSDFLLVQTQPGSPWLPFRDTFEVDGRPVRDREERLTRLFLEPTTSVTLEQATAIANESSRHNIGNIHRTINNPVLAITFLQADWQERFTWTVRDHDSDIGPFVWTLGYREVARPTIIRSPNDLPARGRFWVDIETGRVLRAELIVDTFEVNATITTTFGQDDRFGMDVPVSMEERYVLANGTEILGTATYDHFRQFEVITEQVTRGR